VPYRRRSNVAPVDGRLCVGAVAGGCWKEAPQGRRKALEAVFVATMKGIDTYMNVEEFEMLKQQSQELREKKVF